MAYTQINPSIGGGYTSPTIQERESRAEWKRMANLANMRYSNVRQPSLKELMDQSSDPFYHAGITKLENVRGLGDHPFFQRGTAPNPEEIDKALLKSETEGFQGYTTPGNWEMYVGSVDNPTAETAATTTHEGIHNIFDPALTGMGEGVIQGTISDSGSALGGEWTTQEIMTNYLSNLIHGENEPFYPEVYNDLNQLVDYSTMMRPGQGPIGMKGIMELLAKRGKPLLRKGALRAHRNIEGRYQPPISPGGGGGGGWSPSGADLSPGGGYGQSPTGSDIAGTPFSRGGILGAF